MELRMVLITGEGQQAQHVRMDLELLDLDLSPGQFSERMLVPAWTIIRNTLLESMDRGEEAVPRQEKPARFLVEVVSKKDEKHGTRSYTFDPGIRLEVSGIAPSENPAMSFTRLPEMPSLEELLSVYHSAVAGLVVRDSQHATGILAVLKACGLEVVE